MGTVVSVRSDGADTVRRVHWTHADHQDRLRTDGPFDVIVIGGGIVGVGTALDAASRGAKVALLERRDFASGTSSRSTKLFHGGIRYLPHFEFGLVREGLLEQRVLQRIADFLYEPLEFLVPMYEGRRLADLPSWATIPSLAPLAMRTGLILYDTLGRRKWGSHRALDADELHAALPKLRTEGLKGGFAYQDAQTDDSRLAITVLKTAVRRYDAVAAGGTEVTDISQDGDEFVVTTSAGEESFEVRGRSLVAATGTMRPPGIGAQQPRDVTLSSGAHLVFECGDLGIGQQAVFLPETEDQRVLFVIPWQGKAMLGTTDRPWTGAADSPKPTDEEIDYLMRHVDMYFDAGSPEPISAFSGLRALVQDSSEGTSKASREHSVDEIVPGYVHVAGGKLTTYRRIAAQAVDAVSDHVGLPDESMTDEEMLVGAGAGTGAAAGLAGSHDWVSADIAIQLISRYGTEARTVVAIAEELGMYDLLSDGETLAAEIPYQVRHEAAQSLSDVALRRTHLSWFSRSHGRDDVERMAEVMGAELGWSDAESAAAKQAFEDELQWEGL